MYSKPILDDLQRRVDRCSEVIQPIPFQISVEPAGLSYISKLDYSDGQLAELLYQAASFKVRYNSDAGQRTLLGVHIPQPVTLKQVDLDQVVAANQILSMRDHEIDRVTDALQNATLEYIEKVVIMARVMSVQKRIETAFSLDIGVRTLGLKLKEIRDR